LVEFASTIPIKYKLKWKSPLHQAKAIFTNSFKVSENLDNSKYILRKLGLKTLPKEIVSRRKKGFPVPLDDWANNGMIENAKEILLDDKTRSRGIFRHSQLEKMLNNNQRLDYDFWGKKVWMLMNVEMWYREFID
jgi:asparagine synthase (glutamine-hydrolysing)